MEEYLKMNRLKRLTTIVLVSGLALTVCTKKVTTPEAQYKEPLSFDLYKTYEDVPLDKNYVKKVHDTWNNELKDDETIKSNTWLVGDYKVFVYAHGYIYGMLDTSYNEILFFTTTKPKKSTDKIHNTITVFEATFWDTSIDLSKIKTYVFVNKYHPIKNETEAKNIMLNYLDEYLCYGSLIGYLKEGLQADGYIREWDDHYVYEKTPHDFGGAIIVNKLSSKLDFLGSSVWMGTGKRYFPIDEPTE